MRRLVPVLLMVGLVLAATPRAAAMAGPSPDLQAVTQGRVAAEQGPAAAEQGGAVGPGQADERALQDLTEQERQVLAELLRLEQELAAARAAAQAAEEEARRVRTDLAALRERVQELRTRQRRLEERLARRLRHYYEEGGTGYLEALLGAGTLSDLLWRLDLLARVAAADAQLLNQVRTTRGELVKEEAALAAQADRLDALLAEEKAQEARIAALVAAREAELVALREQRGALERSLAQLQAAWEQEALPVLKGLVEAFQSLPEQLVYLEPDAVQYRLYPPGATVTLSEAALNRFFQAVPAVQGLQMSLMPNQANAAGTFAGVSLSIQGRFVPVQPALLRYEPISVELAGVRLPPDLVGGVLGPGQLDLDLAEIVRPGRLHRVRMEQEQLVLEVGL